MSGPGKQVVLGGGGTRLVIDNVRPFGDDEDNLLGMMGFDQFGAMFHVEFISVRETDEGEQVPTRDPHGRYEDLFTVVGADVKGFQIVRLPGYEGAYVMCIYPFED